MKTRLVELPVSTGEGQFTAHYTDKGLTRLFFPKSAYLEKERAQSLVSTGPETRDADSRQRKIQILRWHNLTTAAVKKILAGGKPKEFPPLDLAGTTFQKKVWAAMLEIAPGKTKSYGEIARAVGKPKAVRAVGGACGANPIPVLVPCHRVLAAHGKIGGFSSGLHWKRTLLGREGLEFHGESLA